MPLGPVPAITQPAEQSQPEAELAVDAEIIVPRDFEEAVETICNALFQNPEQMDFSVVSVPLIAGIQN